MTFDFSKLKSRKNEKLPLDPIELFQKLKISDPGINDLWLAQGDALRKWHENRAKEDIGIVLNTGAGKTLVGLLIAQSLVNETRDKVLYACSSIQLVEQTEEKARGYGLNFTTYFRRDFSNDLFIRGKAPCITTYQALFNGKSRFFREQISAVVFDDAHAAEHLLRDHFSLRIGRSAFDGVYGELLALFKRYHETVGKAGSYAELDNPDSRQLFLVPPFETNSQRAELLRILQEAGFQSSTDTMFAWEHIKDHIDTCCVLISGSDITVTPPFVPVTTLPYFAREVRRVYLSATLSAPDAFARTFGKVPNAVVAPSTTAGECERLILFPSQLGVDQEDSEIAKEIIRKHKALILVPTYAQATKWKGVAEPPPREEVSIHVSKFKKGTGAEKLLLAARFDGVDLPGDTCRVMVIDDLPTGVGALERFLWEYLGLANTLRSAVASRIVQSFGRISRGMSDHGVVIMTGKRLVDWVLVPKNRALLPAFLQKQLALGDMVSEEATAIDDFISAANQCLTRDNGWIRAYNDYMSNSEPEELNVDIDLLTRLARSEAEYGQLMWRREYAKAVKTLVSTLEDSFSLSASTGAWHCLWLGAAYLCLGDNNSAEEMFARAHANKHNIPPYPRENEALGERPTLNQIVAVEQQLKINAVGSIVLPKRLDTDLIYLDGTGTPPQTEEALRSLGQYLGLESSRPEKEFGTGPDVLWISNEMTALCMEVKSGKEMTDKESNTKYRKRDIGQLSDHVQWVKDNTNAERIIPVFVGPVVGATNTANPPEEYRVIGLEQFASLAKKLKAALTDSATAALPLTLRNTLETVFGDRNLIWPDCLDELEFHSLKDL